VRELSFKPRTHYWGLWLSRQVSRRGAEHPYGCGLWRISARQGWAPQAISSIGCHNRFAAPRAKNRV